MINSIGFPPTDPVPAVASMIVELDLATPQWVIVLPAEVTVPPEPMLINDPEKPLSKAEVGALEKVMSIALTSCPADVGFASRSLRETTTEPLSVVIVAEALTGPFAPVPEALYVITDACAVPIAVKTATAAAATFM